jgi:hypothetical protein
MFFYFLNSTLIKNLEMCSNFLRTFYLKKIKFFKKLNFTNQLSENQMVSPIFYENRRFWSARNLQHPRSTF